MLKKLMVIVPLLFLSVHAQFGVSAGINTSVPVFDLKENYEPGVGFDGFVFLYEDDPFMISKLGLAYELTTLKGKDSIKDVHGHGISIKVDHTSTFYYSLGNTLGVYWYGSEGKKKTVYFGGVSSTGLAIPVGKKVVFNLGISDHVYIEKTKFWHQFVSNIIFQAPSYFFLDMHSEGYSERSTGKVIAGYCGTVLMQGLLSYAYSKKTPWPFEDCGDAENYVSPRLGIDIFF